MIAEFNYQNKKTPHYFGLLALVMIPSSPDSFAPAYIFSFAMFVWFFYSFDIAFSRKGWSLESSTLKQYSPVVIGAWEGHVLHPANLPGQVRHIVIVIH